MLIALVLGPAACGTEEVGPAPVGPHCGGLTSAPTGDGGGTEGGDGAGPPPDADAERVQTGACLSLPVKQATEGWPAIGFSAGGRVHPAGRPGRWRIEYGPTAEYGATTDWRSLPGRLTAHYVERWDRGTAGWAGSAAGDGLRWQPGGFVRYTEDDYVGNDYNHADGVGIVHLPAYLHTGYVDGGFPLPRLGGGNPDLRGAKLAMRVRSTNWRSAGTKLWTWIQSYNDVTLVARDYDSVANFALSSLDHTPAVAAAKDWVDIAWSLPNDATRWTYAGKNAEQDVDAGPRYQYGELDGRLGDVQTDIFPMMVVGVNLEDVPTGSIDFDDFELTYRQHSVCAPSNGGHLVGAPRGTTATELLTDGWRNGAGREWSEVPSGVPLELTYAFERPIALEKVQLHNSVEWPSRAVEIEASTDAGATWTPLGAMELEESSTNGTNFTFGLLEAFNESTNEWRPLLPDPVTHLRVRILSGYRSTRWGLGEIEAFGAGAAELTDDTWYDVNADVKVPPGTWHYRVVADLDGTVSYGKDATATVAAPGAPRVTAIDPPGGSVQGDTLLRIDGRDLARVTEVTVGGARATLVVGSKNLVWVRTPPGVVGAADLVLKTEAGTDTVRGAHTYRSGPPD